MKRPELIHFSAVETKERIHVKASLAMLSRESNFFMESPPDEDFSPESPWESIGLLRRYRFIIKLIGLDSEQHEVFKKQYESDSFGNFLFKIPKNLTSGPIKIIQVYEVGTYEGLELMVGTFIPIEIKEPKKIVISDFDKTLVDTRYSTTKELYRSLTRPLDHFPKVDGSIELLRKFIVEGFQPFILTASPHFYERAIRDWLYQNQIYTAGIFLKDYRRVLSFWNTDLTPKDIKTQGFYKLDQLVSILLMTGVPSELILMGDGFESDPLIYLTLRSILLDEVDPWSLWNKLRKADSFRLNSKQNSAFLAKIYQLKSLQKECGGIKPKMQILIRQKENQKLPEIPIEFLRRKKEAITYYQA